MLAVLTSAVTDRVYFKCWSHQFCSASNFRLRPIITREVKGGARVGQLSGEGTQMASHHCSLAEKLCNVSHPSCLVPLLLKALVPSAFFTCSHRTYCWRTIGGEGIVPQILSIVQSAKTKYCFIITTWLTRVPACQPVLPCPNWCPDRRRSPCSPNHLCSQRFLWQCWPPPPPPLMEY